LRSTQARRYPLPFPPSSTPRRLTRTTTCATRHSLRALFNAASTPDIRFVSTKIEGTDPKHFTITGDLTMHGETHPVALDAQVIASGKSPRGRSIIAYGATVTIDRTQWGITYGPLIVGNSVDISLNIEADGPT